ncbi:helix-turn-helix transcriptional regulator [Leptospira santarosai]|uniref:helix-turn-helix domain-containing protein n=1 Tax=Leptospira santarosai TaxID=28183 RepID=UPI0024AFD8A7|nr:helix-turn-helix transcriptional regulator [Leptospira santarosai]MDI7219378.1 helix-turn-helix transcriptional regulator [Leptospira santarosai]
MNTPGERVKYIRTEGTGQKFNQDEFASSIGISQEFLSQIENNKRDLTDRTALTIELKHGFRKEWTLTGIGPQKKTSHPLTPLSEDKIREMDTHDRRVRKMTTTPGATEMLDDYLSLNERDRATVNALIKQLKG